MYFHAFGINLDEKTGTSLVFIYEYCNLNGQVLLCIVCSAHINSNKNSGGKYGLPFLTKIEKTTDCDTKLHNTRSNNLYTINKCELLNSEYNI